MAVLQVVITGGAGQIAYSLIPLIARGLVFGPGTRVHLRLLDISPAAQALEGVAMEIQDSLFSTALEGVLATTDDALAFEGAQVAILLGGFPRKPGMQRGDLIAKNVGIMKRMGQVMERHASRDCKVLVVANPAPTNCLVLAANAPSLPRKNFSCLSRLDHDRMVGMLLKKANSVLAATPSGHTARLQRLLPSDVRGVCVWGNHSDSQVPDASAVEFRVNGHWVPAATLLEDPVWLQELQGAKASEPMANVEKNLADMVRTRGAAVLAARKMSSAMSAANAAAAHLADWVCPSSVGKTVSMGVFTDGNPFGVPDGLVCSLPVRCGSLGGGSEGGWSFDSGFKVTKEVSKHLAESVSELQVERDMALGVLNGRQGMSGGDSHVSVPSKVTNESFNGPAPGLASGGTNGAIGIDQQPHSSL